MRTAIEALSKDLKGKEVLKALATLTEGDETWDLLAQHVKRSEGQRSAQSTGDFDRRRKNCANCVTGGFAVRAETLLSGRH